MKDIIDDMRPSLNNVSEAVNEKFFNLTVSESTTARKRRTGEGETDASFWLRPVTYHVFVFSYACRCSSERLVNYTHRGDN